MIVQQNQQSQNVSGNAWSAKYGRLRSLRDREHREERRNSGIVHSKRLEAFRLHKEPCFQVNWIGHKQFTVWAHVWRWTCRTSGGLWSKPWERLRMISTLLILDGLIQPPSLAAAHQAVSCKTQYDPEHLYLEGVEQQWDRPHWIDGERKLMRHESPMKFSAPSRQQLVLARNEN
ncbi:hypothetical protein BDZ89DRAFT_1202141 [Hymenopellis radicata]|nr:hypothetical protein BDZ89DRAFT_1202141 [Hymenopellis radicata]